MSTSSARVSRTERLGSRRTTHILTVLLSRPPSFTVMPGELFEIEGEKKKRVVCSEFFFSLSFPKVVSHRVLPRTRSAISSTPTSEGFIMDPDTRMFQFFMTMTVL